MINKYAKRTDFPYGVNGYSCTINNTCNNTTYNEVEMNKNKLVKFIKISAQILFYIIAIILIIQIIRLLLGGSWTIENVILALVIANLTLTVTLMGMVYQVNNRLSGHIGWHKGFQEGRNKI